MTKREIASKLNDIMSRARREAHDLLKSEKCEIGSAAEMWRLMLPDDGKFMMSREGMRVAERRQKLADAFQKFLSYGDELKASDLVYEDELREYADKMTSEEREFEEVKKTPEYKEYMRLFKKFSKYFTK